MSSSLRARKLATAPPITAAEARSLLSKPRKRSKYRNVPQYLVGAVVTADKDHAYALAKGTGVKVVRFASYAEYERDAELHLGQRAGKIGALRRQPRFPLVVGGQKICTYVGDWEYVEMSDVRQVIVEDRKGALTAAFKIKWALAKALHPEIEWRLS